MSARLLFCFALWLRVPGAHAAAPDAARARDLMRNLPVRFEANAGQWNPRVKFFARTQDSQLLLTSREAVLSAGGRTVGLSMLHANPAPRIEGLEPQAVRANYFLGSTRDRWRAGVTQYGRVRYAGVYPGIDLVYYGSQSRLEYDLVLHPSADPRQIRLKFRGADRLRVSPAGDLVASAGEAEIVQQKPVIYQETVDGERRLVEGRYKLLGSNQVGVEVAAYDRSRTLTIDPVLVYSSLLGGGGTDAIVGVKLDRAGMVWVGGYTTNGDLAATDGAYQNKSGGGGNLFLARIDPKADPGSSLRYLTYIGGSGTDKLNAMDMDAQGFIYLAGSTTSIDFPRGGQTSQSGLAGGTDAFVIKFNPNESDLAQMTFSTYLGGGDEDAANGVAADRDGNIYVVGTTRSTDFPLTSTAYAGVLYGPQDAFIAKYDPTSSTPLVYSTYFGGELRDYGQAIAVTPNGTVYVGGSTESTGLPQAGFQYRSTISGFLDVWLAQMDLTKIGVDTLVYSTYFGGSDLDELGAITIDSTGKVVLAGYTMSGDFPATGNAVRTSIAGNADAFVARVDFTKPPQSFVDYATFLGGVHGDAAYGVAADTAGNIYVTGYTLSADFPVTPDALVKTGGGTSTFITKLNPATGLVYSTYLGPTGQHVGYSVTVGSDGKFYVGGVTALQDVFVSSNANQPDYGGGLSDGFLVVFTP